MHELDPEPFFSPGHPQGDDLKRILEAGERYRQVRAGRALLPAPLPADGTAEQPAPSRSPFGTVFNWVIEKGLRKREGALQLQSDAVRELQAGRPRLLEFVKRHRHSLEESRLTPIPPRTRTPPCSTTNR